MTVSVWLLLITPIWAAASGSLYRYLAEDAGGADKIDQRFQIGRPGQGRDFARIAAALSVPRAALQESSRNGVLLGLGGAAIWALVAVPIAGEVAQWLSGVPGAPMWAQLAWFVFVAALAARQTVAGADRSMPRDIAGMTAIVAAILAVLTLLHPPRQ